MLQDAFTTEPPTTPPPLPPRSLLRNGSAYQLRLRTIRSRIEETSTTAPSSPVSQALIEEIDRELADTHERLVSAILEGRDMHGDADRFSWQTWEGSEVEPNERRIGRSPAELYSVKEFFLSEMASQMSYENDRPEPLLTGRSSADTGIWSEGRDQEAEDGIVGNVEVIGHVSTGQGSHDAAPSSHHTTRNISCKDENQHSCEEEMDTKVEDWLARGFLPAASLAVGHSRRVSGGSDRAFLTKQPALSLFPPKSPLTGNREYTPPNSPFAWPPCPMSPLGNRKDAYGNYIPTNSRDYFVALSPPTSPVLRPIPEDQVPSAPTSLRAIPEGQTTSTPRKSSPVVHLRGGGWIKPFWKTAGAGGGIEAPASTPPYRVTDGHGVARDVPAVKYIGRSGGRKAPSVRSQSSVPDSSRDSRLTERVKARSSTNDGGRHDVGHHGQHIASFDRPKTQDTVNTEGSSEYRARVDKVLGEYGGFFAPSSPIVPTSAGASSLIQQQTISDGSVAPDYPRRPTQPIANQRPLSDDTADSWESQETASTVRSHEASPRVEKRWDRYNPSPPPRAPPPVPPRYPVLEPLHHGHEDEDHSSIYSDDSGNRPAPSIAMSATTANDPFRDLPDLQTSKAYRNVAHAQEVQRIDKQRRLHEEEDRKRREVILRQRAQAQEPDRSTIVPDNSISEQTKARRRLANVRPVERMPPVLEQHRTPSPYIPLFGPIPRHQRPYKIQQGQYTIGSPIAVQVAEPAAPVQPGRPRKDSLQKARYVVGKISRFILAAPSDPDLKTYSRRFPPAEETRQPGTDVGRTGFSVPVNTGPPGVLVPPPALGWSEQRTKYKPQKTNAARDSPTGMRAGNPQTNISRKKKKKNKGKERAVEEPHSPGTEAQDFATRDALMKDLPSIPAPPAGPTEAVRAGYPRSVPPPRQEERAAKPPEQVNGGLGYPAHWDLNEFYSNGDQGRITGAWVGRAAQEHTPLRGGGGEPSSLAAHHHLLTRGALKIDPTPSKTSKLADIDTFLLSSTHLGLDEATIEALTHTAAERSGKEDDQEVNVRSSWSTDSTIEAIREKRRREIAWREEEYARAMARAMRL